MASPQASTDGGKAAGANALADLPAFTVELDKSRTFSEVHGDHVFNLGFIQDGVPFDKGSRLIRELFGKPGFERAGDTFKRKVKALQTAYAQAAEADDEDTNNKIGPTEVIVEDPDADVNLRMWAKGQAKYMPMVIYRVIRTRYAKHVGNLADAKAYLVEIKVVAQGEVV